MFNLLFVPYGGHAFRVERGSLSNFSLLQYSGGHFSYRRYEARALATCPVEGQPAVVLLSSGRAAVPVCCL